MPLQQLLEYFDELPSDIDISDYDPDKVPVHVAAIMDGNGRWAKERNLSRSEGHIAGVEGVRSAIRTFSDLGVRYLTIYSFSTENWNRPAEEVELLMTLFAKTMYAELDEMNEEHVRIKLIGDMDALPQSVQDAFYEGVQCTEDNDGMTLVIAVNYGGRADIVHAAKSIAKAAKDGDVDIDDIDEEMFSHNLYTEGIPDPDLIIRTSGEFRISNFLLWQSAYSEFFVTDLLWPDFDKYEALKAIMSFQHRNRRYGKV